MKTSFAKGMNELQNMKTVDHSNKDSFVVQMPSYLNSDGVQMFRQRVQVDISGLLTILVKNTIFDVKKIKISEQLNSALQA